jgi:hypothetical protein
MNIGTQRHTIWKLRTQTPTICEARQTYNGQFLKTVAQITTIVKVCAHKVAICE